MNESTDDDERSIAASGEDIKLADLGNAKIETKQYHPVQLMADSVGNLGWGF